MKDLAEDLAQDIRTVLDCNMIDCDDDEVVGTRIDKMEPIKPGVFEVTRHDGVFRITAEKIG